MAKKKTEQKKEEPKVEEKHVCDICGEPAVIRDSDAHYYCYVHHMEYNKCKEFKQIKEEYEVI